MPEPTIELTLSAKAIKAILHGLKFAKLYLDTRHHPPINKAITEIEQQIRMELRQIEKLEN